MTTTHQELPGRAGGPGRRSAPGKASGDVTSSRASGGDRRPKRLLLQVGGIVVAIGLWYLFAQGHGRTLGIPTPSEVAHKLVDMGRTAQFWRSMRQTLVAALVGFACSVAVGVPLGLLNGLNKRITLSSQFLLDFLRTIPPIAVMPLLLLLYGGSFTMLVVLIMFGAVWPVLLQATYAVQQVSPQLKQVGIAYHLGRGDTFRYIYWPSVLPFLMTGLRIALTLSLLLAVVGGYFGQAPGLGKDLNDTLLGGNTAAMFVYAFVVALLGVLLNTAFVTIQRRVLAWHPPVRGGR